MTERHCNNWTPLCDSDVLEAFLNPRLVDHPQAFDILTSSPGSCSIDKRNTDYNTEVISECRCYTCPKNTLTLGYGYNGQGA